MKERTREIHDSTHISRSQAVKNECVYISEYYDNTLVSKLALLHTPSHPNFRVEDIHYRPKIACFSLFNYVSSLHQHITIRSSTVN